MKERVRGNCEYVMQAWYDWSFPFDTISHHKRRYYSSHNYYLEINPDMILGAIMGADALGWASLEE